MPQEPDSVPNRPAPELSFSLSSSELEEMRQQLQGCPPCLEFIQSLEATVSLCKNLGSAEKPAPLDPSTRQRLLSAYEAVRAGKRNSAAQA